LQPPHLQRSDGALPLSENLGNLRSWEPFYELEDQDFALVVG
jgi:hypothetical protein